MSNFKYGDRVYIKELNEYGRVLATVNGRPLKVKLDSGEIIEVLNLTVELVSLLKTIWRLIKSIFKL